MPRHHDQIPFRGTTGQFIHLGGLGGQRFFDKYMFACFASVKCVAAGVAITTALTSGSCKTCFDDSTGVVRGKFVCTKARRSALESTTYFTRQPGNAEKLRRRFGPQ
jgi:hypothetical protein